MSIAVKHDRTSKTLTLENHHPAGYLGTLILPFSEEPGALVFEKVICTASDTVLHEHYFDASFLGEGNLEPYLIGMTASAIRRVTA